MSDSGVKASSPVSYTHLDVYKRQLYVYAHIGAVEEVVELEFVDVALIVTAHDRFTSGFPEQFEGDCARTPRV